MPGPRLPYVPPWGAALGLDDPTLTTEAKRAHLKTLMEDLTAEGVEVLWPLLLWWVDPFSRTATQFPVIAQEFFDLFG